MILVAARSIPLRRQNDGSIGVTSITPASGTSTASGPSTTLFSQSSPLNSPSISLSSSSSSSSISSSMSMSSTSSPTPTRSSDAQRSSSGIPTSKLIGAIVGGAIGFLFLLLLLSILFTAYRRRRNDVRKRPSSSVVLDRMLPSRSKRPETVYDIDSFIGSTKPSHQRHTGEMSTVPLLPDGSRPSTAYEVDEHGVVDRYTDSLPPPSPASSTAPHTDFSHLASPYSTDGHGDDVVPPIASLSMSSNSTGTTFVPLAASPAGFSVVALSERSNRSASESQYSTSSYITTIPPPPSTTQS